MTFVVLLSLLLIFILSLEGATLAVFFSSPKPGAVLVPLNLSVPTVLGSLYKWDSGGCVWATGGEPEFTPSVLPPRLFQYCNHK